MSGDYWRRERYVWLDLSAAKARKVAKAYKVKMPRCGYEVSLGNGLWLASAGHFQFGAFGLSKNTPPYHLHGYRRLTAG
jgi:hypothetical protein